MGVLNSGGVGKQAIFYLYAVNVSKTVRGTTKVTTVD